jgi:uncharacterized protein (DUF58 family)
MSLRRNALLLALLTALLAIMGEWSGGALAARLWALPAALLLAGLALEAVLLRRCAVQVDVRVPSHWPLARKQRAELGFAQSTRRQLALQVVASAPGEFAASPCLQELHLPAGHEATVGLEAAPRRLGRYAWPAPSLRVGGALRLAWWPRRVHASAVVTVVPDIVSRAERRSGAGAGGATRASTRGAGAEVLQLRDYRRGDPLRAVDWKASARRGRLISREYSEDQHLEVVVAIDAGRASGLGAGEVDRLSLYVTVAARFAQRAAELDDAVGLLIFAAQPLALLPPSRGEGALPRINDLLTACRVQASESNPVLAAARIRSMVQRRSLIVLLSDLEDASAGEQLARAVRLLTPKHLPFIAALQSERIAAMQRAPAREALGAYRALAALEYTDALEGNVRALKALGAAAVIERPESLDRAVLAAYEDFRQRRRI